MVSMPVKERGKVEHYFGKEEKLKEDLSNS